LIVGRPFFWFDRLDDFEDTQIVLQAFYHAMSLCLRGYQVPEMCQQDVPFSTESLRERFVGMPRQPKLSDLWPFFLAM
jgi:hypothetical protein